MPETTTWRFRGVAPLVFGALLATGIIACAGSMRPDAATQSEKIADVRVETDGAATVVTLIGLEDPVFTAFQQTNPDRIVVDLASVESDRMNDPIAVYDGLVEEIMLSPFATGAGESMTRVEISTLGPAEFAVAKGEEGLVVRMEAASVAMDERSAGGEDSLEPSDPWAIEPTVSEWEEETPDAMAPAAGWTAAPATKLTSVDAREVGEGVIVEIHADGTLESAVSFTLENPDRLVIDLPSIVSDLPTRRIEVGSEWIQQLRIGQHDDKVRVVVDAGSAAAPFDDKRVVPVPTGLVVALGSGADLEAALEGATAAMPASSVTMESEEPEPEVADAVEADEDAELAAVVPVEESEAATEEEVADADSSPVTIYGIEFDAQEQRDRLVILGEEPVDYMVYEPSEDTLVLSITGADIDPEAAVRITPEAAGPISLITAFEQPDVEPSEVRVVVKRAANLKPEISRRGALLVLDFPRSGAMAARPPVLEIPPAGPAAGETPGTQLAASSAPAAAAPQAPAVATTALASTAGDAPVAGSGAAAAPASLEPPASIDILNEGGLIDGKEYVGRRISLDFKEVDIADVLRLIAEVSDLNVIAGDEVKGKVTIRLVDVPWDQALDIILLTKGLGFMRIGNVLRIAPTSVISQEEEARLQERRAMERLEDLVVKLQPVNYANASDAQKMVKELLSERGSVNIDKRTNTLILKDIASVIDEATALVKAIDTQTPQVMIESKIVEASLDFSREFGTVWAVGEQPYRDAWDPTSGYRQSRGTSWFRPRPDGIFGDNGVIFGNPITAGPTALANLGAFLLDEKLNLDIELQAAEVNGDGKVISSPRVVTLDNSKAKISQGVSIPFQTFENGDAQLEFVDAVLQLDVEPHITANKSIIMKIKVSRNAPDDSVFTLTGSPAIAKNEVNTETLVNDGQTLVLGGIYVIDKSHRQSRVPYLHSIPILGAMFKNNEISDARKELLIFVTPRIVQGEMKAS